jgi:hypothetical protein
LRTDRGAFILGKLKEHDAAKLADVLADLYRDAVPDAMDITPGGTPCPLH